MQFGWTQSSTNWKVWKNNGDTIITYNFTKQQITDLRIYVVSLQRYSKLYVVEKEENKTKDIIIRNLKTQIVNNDTITIYKDSTITFQRDEIVKLDIWGKSQETAKLKYQKQAKLWPYWLGGGALIGFTGCLMLIK